MCVRACEDVKALNLVSRLYKWSQLMLLMAKLYVEYTNKQRKKKIYYNKQKKNTFNFCHKNQNDTHTKHSSVNVFLPAARATASACLLAPARTCTPTGLGAKTFRTSEQTTLMAAVTSGPTAFVCRYGMSCMFSTRTASCKCSSLRLSPLLSHTSLQEIFWSIFYTSMKI